MKYFFEASFKDATLCQTLLRRLEKTLAERSMNFMEVCGTHTVSIFRSGLRSLLPKGIQHLSGPGCPVCVTHDAEIEACINLAGRDNVILATFGDLLRVPGSQGKSLKYAQAEGARIAIVYSPLEALTLAKKNPQNLVVFLGIGFETTAPTVAATILTAKQQQISNFCVFALHKLVPPVLRTLLDSKECAVEAFLLPGHVSTIIGLQPYKFLASQYHIPGVISGFEPADILLALCLLAEQLRDNVPKIVNAYPRGVQDDGNIQARKLMEQVFVPSDALWRGLGLIPQSGLAIRSVYEDFDAKQRLDLQIPQVEPIPGCKCGEVLKGLITPHECPLFGKKCTPALPVGPCMTSTEGSCAAWFNYAE